MSALLRLCAPQRHKKAGSRVSLYTKLAGYVKVVAEEQTPVNDMHAHSEDLGFEVPESNGPMF